MSHSIAKIQHHSFATKKKTSLPKGKRRERATAIGQNNTAGVNAALNQLHQEERAARRRQSLTTPGARPTPPKPTAPRGKTTLPKSKTAKSIQKDLHRDVFNQGGSWAKAQDATASFNHTYGDLGLEARLVTTQTEAGERPAIVFAEYGDRGQLVVMKGAGVIYNAQGTKPEDFNTVKPIQDILAKRIEDIHMRELKAEIEETQAMTAETSPAQFTNRDFMNSATGEWLSPEGLVEYLNQLEGVTASIRSGAKVDSETIIDIEGGMFMRGSMFVKYYSGQQPDRTGINILCKVLNGAKVSKPEAKT